MRSQGESNHDPTSSGALLVSVIVSSRNRAAKVEALLTSLLACERAANADWEAVICDNDSTDETAAVVKHFAGRYPGRVRYVYQSTRIKAVGLNLAIRHSRGHVIALADDDVRVAPTWLAAIVGAYRGDPDLAGFGGRVELFDPEAAPIAVRRGKAERTISDEPFDPTNISVIGCNLSFRRETLAQIGAYDEAFGPGSVVGSGDDMDILYRAMRHGYRLKYLPGVVVFHDHGRKPGSDVEIASKRFYRGRGGFYLKYGLLDAQIFRCLCREVGSLLLTTCLEISKGRIDRKSLGELRAMASGAAAYLRSRVRPAASPDVTYTFPAQEPAVSDRSSAERR